MDVYQDPTTVNPTEPVPAPDMEALGELTNALGNMVPSKRQVAAASAFTATQQQAPLDEDLHTPASPSAPAQPQPGQEAQLLSRWYQLVGEMQCLMSQMQALNMQPPGYPALAPPTAPAQQTPAPVHVPAAPQQLPTPNSGSPKMMMPNMSIKVGVAAKPSAAASPVVANSPNQWNPSQDPVVGGHHFQHSAASGTSTPPAQPDMDLIQGAALVNANRRQAAMPPRAQSGAVNHNHHGNNHSKNSEPAPYIALVEFKRQRIRRYEAMLFVKPGEYVVVDGDRGTDCGFVVQCAVRNQDGTYGHTESIDNQPVDPNRVKSEAGRIHRVASTAEVNNLHNEIASMERFALKTCRERVNDMNLNMEIVDCEFQFDRKKVTFFFDSHESIDFRELTKDLYRLFGSRIWLENINTKVKNMVPEGALSHSDKMLYAQKGLRAPR